MDISTLGSIGEFIAAIAVVVSLVFVALQLRSNTQAIRGSTYQHIHDMEDRYWRDISNDPKLAELWDRAASGFQQFDESDRRQAEMLLNRIIFTIQAVHYQRRRGFVGDEIWPAWDSAWVVFLRDNAGIQDMYERNIPVFAPEFVEYSSRCIARGKHQTGGSGTLT